MRVGIDIRVAAPREPGQQRYLWRLGAWIAERGHETHYLTVRDQPDDVDPPAGTRLHRFGDLSRRALRNAVVDLELDVLLLNPERSRRYRGLEANVLRSAYGTEQYRQKMRSFRRPVERALRSALRIAPWTLVERRWERAFFEGSREAPEVIAQSRYMASEILDSYSIPEDRVHVVPNAVDTTEYSPEARLALRGQMRARWSIPDDALCLLFLGHNFRLKGLWQMLRVLPGLPPSGAPVHLLVAGRGTGRRQRALAARKVRGAGLASRVTFAGPVRPSLHALAASDALVHLSWHDSFGFVALEAMACGLPVVTTPWVGASELIEDGVSGLIVDPARNDRITDAITSLSRRSLREKIGDRAAAVAAAHDEPGNFEQVLDVFRLAASRNEGPVGIR